MFPPAFPSLLSLIINSNFSTLLIKPSQDIPGTGEVEFPADISVDLFMDREAERTVLFYWVLRDDRKLSVLFISSLPAPLGHKAPPNTALSSCVPTASKIVYF